MARWLVGFLVFAMACDDSGTFSVVGDDGLGGDPADPTDPGTDTDVGGGGGPGGGGPGGGGGGSEAVVWHHAVSSVDVLPATEGFDLDGDGDIDNTFGNLADFLAGRLDDLVGQAEAIIVLQTWQDDDGASIGLLAGTDQDDNLDDNDSGSEVFVVGDDQLDADGRAVEGITVTLNGQGGYTTRLPPGPLNLFGISMPAVTQIRWAGVVDEDTHVVRFGTAVSLAPLEQIMEDNGLGWLVGTLGQFKDIDSDGNGSKDAVSVAFLLEGVPCGVEANP